MAMDTLETWFIFNTLRKKIAWMIFRGYLTTAEICTIHALDQVANKDHPQHYMHGMNMWVYKTILEDHLR